MLAKCSDIAQGISWTRAGNFFEQSPADSCLYHSCYNKVYRGNFFGKKSPLVPLQKHYSSRFQRIRPVSRPRGPFWNKAPREPCENQLLQKRSLKRCLRHMCGCRESGEPFWKKLPDSPFKTERPHGDSNPGLELRRLQGCPLPYRGNAKCCRDDNRHSTI